MKEFPIVTIPFYEFEANESLVDLVLEDVKQLKFVENELTNITPDEYYHPELFDFFDQCLLEIRDKFLIPSLELPIISCWVNKAHRFNRHYEHSHSNSFISGIFYLTTHDNSETIFSIPNPWFHSITDKLHVFRSVTADAGLPDDQWIKGKVKPTKGKLVLFPSNIRHSTSANTSKDFRYTIAFNAFVSGKLGFHGNVATRLEIKTIGVKDRFNRQDNS
jgi:hypothetical protein